MNGSGIGTDGEALASKHLEIVQVLESHMESAYCAENLRLLLHTTPVTEADLERVQKCLKGVPQADVTVFRVSKEEGIGEAGSWILRYRHASVWLELVGM